MATQSLHIVEYRNEPPPPTPPYQPNSINAPIVTPEINSVLEARNAVERTLGVGQTVDALV